MSNFTAEIKIFAAWFKKVLFTVVTWTNRWMQPQSVYEVDVVFLAAIIKFLVLFLQVAPLIKIFRLCQSEKSSE